MVLHFTACLCMCLCVRKTTTAADASIFGGVNPIGTSQNKSSSLEKSDKLLPPGPMSKKSSTPIPKASEEKGSLFDSDDDDIFSFQASTIKKSMLVVTTRVWCVYV